MTATAAVDQVTAFDRNGHLVLRGALDPELRLQLAQASTLLLASERTRGRDRSADGKDGFRGVAAMHDAFLALVANPAVLPTIAALLSENVHLLSSNLIHMPSIPADGTRSIRVPERHGWHQDMSAATRDLAGTPVPRLAIKAAYFLTDITPDAGITMVLPRPGSSTEPVTVPPGSIDPPGALTPDLRAGDVLLFDNRTWHAGGLNTSGTPRLAVMMQYGYRWLAQLDDPTPHLAARKDLTPLQRQLLGAPDRHPDGSVAPEGTGARALHDWLTRLPTRHPSAR